MEYGTFFKVMPGPAVFHFDVSITMFCKIYEIRRHDKTTKKNLISNNKVGWQGLPMRNIVKLIVVEETII